jgi:radical SAM superfamily enzyme YgiQ (UPF0313 family)
MEAVLIATYEMGRQPFGLASPAAWLRAAGHPVTCVDLSLGGRLPEVSIANAGLIAFHLPMHTATRLAVPVIAQIRALNPEAAICCFGLYASMNEAYLRSLGVHWILGAEFEGDLTRVANGQAPVGSADIPRLRFQTPDRSDLPVLANYAALRVGESARVAGYTEASRGCKHLCRHCPVVPVYQGSFRVVQADVVLGDIRSQVAAGARHITFGDPDFFNGPTHARRIVEQLHREFPDVTYDATIKIEHLRRHAELLPVLRDTGCLFVTSAVESVDDAVLARLDKGHTRAEFEAVVEDFRRIGLTLAPTFIAFTPWTTVSGYAELLRTLRALDLVDAVSPVQLALRLLIPPGSLLLDLPEIQKVLTGYDPPALLHRWRHPDPAVDALAREAMRIAGRNLGRREAFGEFWKLAHGVAPPEDFGLLPRAAVPYLDEPWYC